MLTAQRLANVHYQMDINNADRLRGEAMVRAAAAPTEEAFRAAKATAQAKYDHELAAARVAYETAIWYPLAG